jgi:hypothetical protein
MEGGFKGEDEGTEKGAEALGTEATEVNRV